jgi:hypothetical protein
MKYIKKYTTVEVYKVIRNAHPELKLFASGTFMNGNYYTNPNEGYILTEFGFENSNIPYIGVKTTWDCSFKNPSEYKTVYFLYIVKDEDD